MKQLPSLQAELIGILQTLYDTEALTPMMEFCQGEIRVLLYLLAHEGKVYPSQLSESLCVTRQRITTILSAMRKKGLIQMEIEEEDRRKMVYLEPERFTDAPQAVWDGYFFSTEPDGYFEGAHMDFNVIVPYSKKADEGRWKESKLEKVKEYILKQL